MAALITILILAIILVSLYLTMAEKKKERQRKEKSKHDRLQREIHEGKRGYVIEDGMLVWKEQGRIDRMVAIADILILAEVTTDQGPFLDDYFFVVVDRNRNARWLPSQWLSANTLETLITRLSGKWTESLASCIDWNSRIIAPAELSGEPLYHWEASPKDEHSFTDKVNDYYTRTVS